MPSRFNEFNCCSNLSAEQNVDIAINSIIASMFASKQVGKAHSLINY